MSDKPTKTYPPEFLQRLSDDHEAEQAGATTEDSSAVRQKGDAMSEIKRFDIPRHGNECMHEDPDGEYVQYDDYRAEVERLRANGQALLDTLRPSDEDIWREAFITMLPSFPWEKAAEKSDCVLVEYRKRWPR